jgi:predicted GTPase
MGAAGRDFHNFNVALRHDPDVHVVAFTATQIPGIAGRRYPPELAGPRYPEGIAIVGESELGRLIEDCGVDEVVFAYSDVSHEHVMHAGSRALAHGADFRLMGPRSTMLEAKVPVVSVCAVRTGAGKSQTARRVVRLLEAAGVRVVVIRHPMAYGDLRAQAVQRFARRDDLAAAGCTIEEREEYEPHLAEGRMVYAGVDLEAVLELAQEEAQVILWEGGNNDLPFLRPELHLVVADPLRAGDERRYHPGEANLRMADVVVINKVDSASAGQVEAVLASVAELNPSALVIRAESEVSVEDPAAIRGRRVLVVEDGPTLTHGEMSYGAGMVAARRFGASEVVDPRRWASESLRATYQRFSIGPVLPAMGYSPDQVADLAAIVNASDAELVLVATPIDLRALARIDPPVLRVSYELKEVGKPDLEDALAPLMERLR